MVDDRSGVLGGHPSPATTVSSSSSPEEAVPIYAPRMSADEIEATCNAIRAARDAGIPPDAVFERHRRFFTEYPLLCKMVLSPSFNAKHLSFMLDAMRSIDDRGGSRYLDASRKVTRYMDASYIPAELLRRPPTQPPQSSQQAMGGEMMDE